MKIGALILQAILFSADKLKLPKITKIISFQIMILNLMSWTIIA